MLKDRRLHKIAQRRFIPRNRCGLVAHCLPQGGFLIRSRRGRVLHDLPVMDNG